MTFGFVHLKWNKFETNHSFVKSYITGPHICYLITSVKIFWMHLIWFWWEIVLKWLWESFVEKFECLSILNSEVFMKISICYIFYLQIWLKMFNSWNCINVPYWALISSLFVDNLPSNLSSGEEWSLGRKFGFIRTFV